ncbi:type II toxin-antitoxin system RelB/DinJ family antitoxin [Fructilactobacillus sp. Tb1]|uniref:type II toxin-antitoxin system RelB/DinJ family antitoxin n=1 Tax=Fructilactobacillus sp. Tb1 TaxID=3422304 RepID=UPI003D2BD08E
MSEKKRIQVQIDQELANKTEEVLEELGLTTTTAINMFLKRVVATGSIPFSVNLTEREKNLIGILDKSRQLPVITLSSKKEVEDWFNDESQDY